MTDKKNITSNDILTVISEASNSRTMQVDVTNYTEIASQSLEDRRVLDLAVDSQDNSLAIITKERESFGQQAKIYDIGRIRYPVGLPASLNLVLVGLYHDLSLSLSKFRGLTHVSSDLTASYMLL